jgi:hypothetical protein
MYDETEGLPVAALFYRKMLICRWGIADIHRRPGKQTMKLTERIELICVGGPQ